MNVNADIFEDWSFTGGYLYVLRTTAGSIGYDTLSYGTYTMKVKLFKRYLSIETSSDPNMIKQWDIDKLTKKQLVLSTGEGTEYREFTKK